MLFHATGKWAITICREMQASVPLCKGILEEWSSVHQPAPFSFQGGLDLSNLPLSPPKTAKNLLTARGFNHRSFPWTHLLIPESRFPARSLPACLPGSRDTGKAARLLRSGRGLRRSSRPTSPAHCMDSRIISIREFKPYQTKSSRRFPLSCTLCPSLGLLPHPARKSELYHFVT